VSTPRKASQITRLLNAASHGNRDAFDQLFPLVYDELRTLARSKLRRERADHTLAATALVHEAYLQLVDQDSVEWQSRAHFFAVAARAMRRILMNHARAKRATKRGGGASQVPLDEAVALAPDLFTEEEEDDLLALDEALDRLSELSPEGADVLQYRFFGGLTHNEIAEVMGVSEATVRRRWRAAKTWLRQQLDPGRTDRTGTLLGGAA